MSTISKNKKPFSQKEEKTSIIRNQNQIPTTWIDTTFVEETKEQSRIQLKQQQSQKKKLYNTKQEYPHIKTQQSYQKTNQKQQKPSYESQQYTNKKKHHYPQFTHKQNNNQYYSQKSIKSSLSFQKAKPYQNLQGKLQSPGQSNKPYSGQKQHFKNKRQVIRKKNFLTSNYLPFKSIKNFEQQCKQVFKNALKTLKKKPIPITPVIRKKKPFWKIKQDFHRKRQQLRIPDYYYSAMRTPEGMVLRNNKGPQFIRALRPHMLAMANISPISYAPIITKKMKIEEHKREERRKAGYYVKPKSKPKHNYAYTERPHITVRKSLRSFSVHFRLPGTKMKKRKFFSVLYKKYWDFKKAPYIHKYLPKYLEARRIYLKTKYHFGNILGVAGTDPKRFVAIHGYIYKIPGLYEQGDFNKFKEKIKSSPKFAYTWSRKIKRIVKLRRIVKQKFKTAYQKWKASFYTRKASIIWFHRKLQRNKNKQNTIQNALSLFRTVKLQQLRYQQYKKEQQRRLYIRLRPSRTFSSRFWSVQVNQEPKLVLPLEGQDLISKKRTHTLQVRIDTAETWKEWRYYLFKRQLKKKKNQFQTFQTHSFFIKNINNQKILLKSKSILVFKTKLRPIEKILQYFFIPQKYSLYAIKVFTVMEMLLTSVLQNLHIVKYNHLIPDLCFHKLIYCNQKVISNMFSLLSIYDTISIYSRISMLMFFQQQQSFFSNHFQRYYNLYWKSWQQMQPKKFWLAYYALKNQIPESIIFDYPNILFYIKPFRRLVNTVFLQNRTDDFLFFPKQADLGLQHALIKTKIFVYTNFYK